MDYVRNAVRSNRSVVRWGARCLAILACLRACLEVPAAELPAPILTDGTLPPLVTIRQFLDDARQWGETNNLRLQGVVTASLSDKTCFIQDGDAGVYVFHRLRVALRVGEGVEVTGHPSLGNFKPLLDGVAVRSIGTLGSILPVAVTFAEAMSGEHRMQLIRIRGRLAAERPRGGRNLVLNAGDATNSFLADLESFPDDDALSNIEPGSLLELTGVCNLRSDTTRTRPMSLTVFVRSAADVVVISGPSWWTHQRTAWVLTLSLGALSLTAGWSWALRRQVARQTADLRVRLERESALEQRYRHLFESNPHPMWVYNLKTLGFLAVNDAAIHHYGFSRAEFLTMTLRDIRPPEDVPALEKAVAGVTSGLNPSGVWRHRKKNGQLIEVEVKSHTTEFDGHDAEVVLALDVTEQRRAESALRASEQYRRAIIEAEPECVKVVSAEGMLLDMNRAGLDMLEAGSLAEAACCPLMGYLLPEHQKPFAELHRRVMAGGSGMLEFEVVGLKGTRRWLETHAVLLPGADGGKPALLGITRDVTERKKAQADALRSQERFATIFRASPDAIMIARVSDERIVEVNPAFERLLGYSAAEALGRTTLELGLWVNLAERTATIAQIKANGAISNGEARLRSKDGRIFDALSSAEVLIYEGERCMMSLTRDITQRKAAEERQRRSEASLAAAQHIASLGSWELDLSDAAHTDRNSLTWSDEVFRIFGYDPGAIEVTNENFFRAVHPDDRQRVKEAVAEAIAGRRSYRIDHRILRPDGTERIVQEYSETVIDPATGRSVRMLGVVQDITERRRDEATRREMQEQLRGILHNSPSLIFLKDIMGRYLLVNRKFAEVFELSLEQVVGKTDAELFPPEQAAAFEANDRKVIEAGAALQFEESALHKDGRHTGIVSKFPLLDSQGRIYAVGGIVTDITTQREAEERIRKMNTELEQRVQERTAQIDRLYRRQTALAEIELAVNQPTELQSVLDRAVAVVSEGLGTRGGASIVLWDSQQEGFTVSASTVLGQPEQLAARRIRRSGGASRWIVDQRRPIIVPDIREDPFRANSMLPEYGMQSYAGVPLFVEEQALGVFYVLHDQPRAFSEEDVTFMEAVASRVAVAIFKVRLYERIQGVNRILRQRSTELEAANKELEAFSYSVSHDLRAPLRAIDGFSKILEQDASSQLDEKCLRYLDRIRSGTERMGVLIDDMLKLSRLSRAPMKRVELDLSGMVSEALADLRAAEPERQVETVVAPDLKAEGDASLLRAVLENFVSNAWKYTSRRPKARIEFGALDRDGERVFFIRDDGAGFDMAYVDKLFGAFQRLHGVDEFEGTGIGLATVQRVIHRHGGRVWAEAIVDQGATFYFTLAPKIEPT